MVSPKAASHCYTFAVFPVKINLDLRLTVTLITIGWVPSANVFDVLSSNFMVAIVCYQPHVVPLIGTT